MNDLMPSETQFSPIGTSQKNKKYRKQFTIATVLTIIVATAAICIWQFYNLQTPPKEFPLDMPIVIESGTPLRGIAQILRDNNVISSQYVFYLIAVLEYDPQRFKAGRYTFSDPQSMRAVIETLLEGETTSNTVSLTLPEGLSVSVWAPSITQILPHIPPDDFIAAAKPHEGKLFPDTYIVPLDYPLERLIDLLLEQHKKVFKEVSIESETNLSADEIIILASILEREANSSESKKMVSGILQNRLAINMPLQADATMEYVLGRPLATLTPEDLRQPSPYNTYLNQGLPPTPIGNPGRMAMEAVLNPAQSNYFFYITAPDGTFYYARDFDEHRLNIARYLR